jgi:hypothetical protein
MATDDMDVEGIEEAKEHPDAIAQGLVMLTTVLLVVAVVMVFMHLGHSYGMGPFKP